MRAYAISPYGIGVNYSQGSNLHIIILVYPPIPSILVHAQILVHPPIPSILVQISDGRAASRLSLDNRRTPNIHWVQLPPRLRSGIKPFPASNSPAILLSFP